MNRHTSWSLRNIFFWLQLRIAGYLTGMFNNMAIITIVANITYFCIWKSTHILSAHEIKHKVHLAMASSGYPELTSQMHGFIFSKVLCYILELTF